jgi:hypothetical protein
MSAISIRSRTARCTEKTCNIDKSWTGNNENTFSVGMMQYLYQNSLKTGLRGQNPDYNEKRLFFMEISVFQTQCNPGGFEGQIGKLHA